MDLFETWRLDFVVVNLELQVGSCGLRESLDDQGGH